MQETELEKTMLHEVRILLADLEAGREPANTAFARVVREQVAGQIKSTRR